MTSRIFRLGVKTKSFTGFWQHLRFVQLLNNRSTGDFKGCSSAYIYATVFANPRALFSIGGDENQAE
jgi:hypothetical protein